MKCKHESCNVEFVQVISATPHEIVALFQETCNTCGKHLGKAEEITFKRVY